MVYPALISPSLHICIIGTSDVRKGPYSKQGVRLKIAKKPRCHCTNNVWNCESE